MNGLLQIWTDTVDMIETALEEDLHQDASMYRREEQTTNDIAFEVLVLPDRCVGAPDTDQESMYPVAPELADADVSTGVVADQDHHLVTDHFEDHHPVAQDHHLATDQDHQLVTDHLEDHHLVAQDQDQDRHSPLTTSLPIALTWTSPMLLLKSHNW